MPCPELIELEHFVTGELDPPTRELLTQHLTHCSACGSRLDDVRDNLEAVDAVRSALSGSDDSDPAHGAKRIGDAVSVADYTLIREIGRGGMGVVYMARQIKTQRMVALKVINRVVATGDRRAVLFDREIRALGRLQHPGIAGIHEAGTTDDGRPFFSMELVEGLPLLAYAAYHQFDLPARLALFERVCDAVAYAHRRGVIHRDLKPSNILVDAAGRPRVLDFGLARLLEPDSDEPVVSLTEAGRVFGTVPYMSPEQVRGNGSGMDTRTDLYSLGVILYELVTGRLPYTIDSANLPGAARTICEASPARPSIFEPRARGDLETILLTALRKDPDERYPGVSDLAADLERWRRHEPLLARPATFSYHFRKLVARHKLLFGLSVTFLALLILFGASLAVLAVKLHRERQTALTARQHAESQQAQAEAVSQFLQDTLAAADPSVRPAGTDLTLREVLDDAAAKVERDAFGDFPQVAVPLQTTIGNAYRAIGRFDDAETHLRAAVTLGRSLYPQGHADLSMAMNKLARLREEQADYDEAEALFREALAMRIRLLGEEHPDVAVLQNNLGLLLNRRGRGAEGEAMLRKALDIRVRHHGEVHESVATTLNNLAMVLRNRGALAEAEALFRRSLDVDRSVRGGDHPHIAATMSNLGTVLIERGDHAGAAKLLREALAMTIRLHGPEHPSVATQMNNLALAVRGLGDPEEAERLYRESLALETRLRGENHPNLAKTLQNLAVLLESRGQVEESLTLHRRALDIRLAAFGEQHVEPLMSRYHLAGTLIKHDRLDEGEAMLNELLERAAETYPPGHWHLGMFLQLRGDCLARRGHHDEALTALLEAYELLDAVFGERNARTRGVASKIADLYARSDDAPQVAHWRALAD